MTNFQEVLKADFAWPRKGDIPFTPPTERPMTARVDQNGQPRVSPMMTGYKESADLLVAKTLENRDLRDVLIYPIIFNYRHFVEKSVKYLTYTFGHAVGIQPDWKSNDIAVLWAKFLRIQAVYGVDHFDQANLLMSKVIAPFAKIDPDSFAYRYPVDMAGKLIPVGIDELDLSLLAKVMAGAEAYFNGCDDYLTCVQEAAP